MPPKAKQSDAPADLVALAGRLQVRHIDTLLPYARNARTHAEGQVKELAASIVEFGWTNPVLGDSRGILAGHGRTMAAKLLFDQGLPVKLPSGEELPLGMVPFIDCEGWSESKRRAYILADNKLALNAGWDVSMLKLELAELAAEDYDLSLTGFHADELAELFAPEIDPNAADPNEIPEVPEEPLSVMGDIWLLGPHRVRCGDSTSITDWDALMQGELADGQFCDPPYNVAYESKLAGSIKNDSMGDRAFYEFLLGFYTCSFAVMKQGAAIYVAHADSEGANFRQAFKDAGFKLASCLMWVKNALVMGRGDFHYRHEPILYGWKTGGAHRWYGGRKQTTVQDLGESSPFEKLPDGRYAVRNGDSVMYVTGDAVVEEAPSTLLHVDKPKRSALHPTIKPTELIEKCLRNNLRAKDIVIDGFGGSGSTLIAAERLGMVARLQEFDPKFVDVICARYYGYTGRLPVHAVTGLEFPRERLDALLAK